jgi:hypothetical protein
LNFYTLISQKTTVYEWRNIVKSGFKYPQPWQQYIISVTVIGCKYKVFLHKYLRWISMKFFLYICARPNTFEMVTIRQPRQGEPDTLITKTYNTMTSTRYIDKYGGIYLITKCSIEYTSPRTGFGPTTLVVISTDCTGSCKSNYHMITTKTALLGCKSLYWYTLYLSWFILSASNKKNFIEIQRKYLWRNTLYLQPITVTEIIYCCHGCGYLNPLANALLILLHQLILSSFVSAESICLKK